MTRNRLLPAALMALLTAAAGRADNIDARLYSETTKVVEQIVKNKYRNVGVLHFRLKKGDGPESFTLGPICADMATRLETALVIHDPVDRPFGIARNVTAAAAARKVGGWQRRPAERAKLFAASYAPMWGTDLVKPDALLTGVVRLSKDLTTATVVIEAIPASAPQNLVKLHEFTVRTDRNILHEAGQTFVVPVGSRGMRSSQRDEAAAQDARRRDAGSAQFAASPEDVAGLALKVFYNGQEQPIQPDANSGGEWRLPPPAQGTKVTVQVRNTGTRAPKLGAALSFNGRSFWRQETGEPTNSQIWIFDANAPQWTEFRGFYTEHTGNNLIPFKVLSDEESKQREAEFGDKVGLLQMDVYEPGQAQAEDDMKISLARGFAPKSARSRPQTLEAAKRIAYVSDRLLFRAGRNSASHRGLIVGEDENKVPGGDLKIDEIPTPTRVGSLTIRYYDPSGGAAGAMQISN